MSTELEPGSMGRLAILIAEVRALKAGADRLAAEIASVHQMQIQTLGFLQEMLALFTAPLTPPADEVQTAYEPDAGPAGEGVDAVPAAPPTDEPASQEAAPAPAAKARKRAKA